MDWRNKITPEFNETDWEEFELNWIEEQADSAVAEWGEKLETAKEQAAIEYERYLNQEGWHSRDEEILMKRELNGESK